MEISAQTGSVLSDNQQRDDQNQLAKEQLRTLIEGIELMPATERGKVHATLTSELGTILNWIERQVIGNTAKTKNPAASATGVLVSVVAGAGFEPAAFRL